MRSTASCKEALEVTSQVMGWVFACFLLVWDSALQWRRRDVQSLVRLLR